MIEGDTNRELRLNNERKCESVISYDMVRRIDELALSFTNALSSIYLAPRGFFVAIFMRERTVVSVLCLMMC